jgi:hypothetical protein
MMRRMSRKVVVKVAAAGFERGIEEVGGWVEAPDWVSKVDTAE